MKFNTPTYLNLFFPVLLVQTVKHFILDLPVQFVLIHCINAILESLVFLLQETDLLVMVGLLIPVALLESLANPCQNLIIEFRAYAKTKLAASEYCDGTRSHMTRSGKAGHVPSQPFVDGLWIVGKTHRSLANNE